MKENTKEQIIEFIKTLTKMPIRTQAVCGIILYVDPWTIPELKQIVREVSLESNISIVEFTHVSDLTKLIDENSNMQIQKGSPYPVLCLIGEKNFQKKNLDMFSPLVFRLNLYDNESQNF